MAVAADVLPAAPTRRRVAWGSVLTWLLILGAVAGWTAFLRPASLGGSAGYVIVSGESMEPMMHTGDLAIVRRQPTYANGDVVAYRIPESDVGGGMLVIHRVIGGSPEEGLVLQGDNREHPDTWRPKDEDVVGSLQVYIPNAGTALFLLRTPLVLGTAAGLLGFWFIVLRGDDEKPAPAEEGEVEADVEPSAPEQPRLRQPALRPFPTASGPRPPAGYRPLLGAALVGVAIGVAAGGLKRG